MPPFSAVEPPPPDRRRPRARPIEVKAVASFALGLMALLGAMFGLSLLLGIPAILFGSAARADIRRAHGRLGGSGLANAGVALGAFGATLFVGWASVVAIAASPHAGALELGLRRALDRAAPRCPRVSARVETEASEGLVNMVELDPLAGPLANQLGGQASAALRAGELLLVETTSADCWRCDLIARAMPDDSMQLALAKVRLVRVDVRKFPSEISNDRLWIGEGVPSFYLVDERGEPRDAIGADDWDDSDPKTVASVLGAFVRGKLHVRTHTWRGSVPL